MLRQIREEFYCRKEITFVIKMNFRSLCRVPVPFVYTRAAGTFHTIEIISVTRLARSKISDEYGVTSLIAARNM